MAYGLKYTQYISKGGTTLRVNVYAKDWTGATYGMAHVLGASLQIVGGQADIISPIIKTAFSWSLADAWDQGATQADGTTCVNAQGEKCGRWEEFYTKDATKFRVEVLNGSTVIWRGYVTPDSWTEEMQFHGSVTITARDMLGALQDAEFDLTGRVTVLDVVRGALAACECPMDLSYVQAHFLVNENGQSILDHDFAASTFSGRNWYQALQDTLESLGLVLRYNGAGQIVLTSLRYLAADTLQGHHEVAYANRSGLRSLDPALKLITETFDLERNSYVPKDPDAAQFTATGGTITCSMTVTRPGSTPQTATGVVKAYTLARPGSEGWSGNLGIPMYGTAESGAVLRGIYFPCGTQDVSNTLEAVYTNTRIDRAFRFSLALDGGLMQVTNGASAGAVFKAPLTSSFIYVPDVTIRVQCVADGVTYYLNSEGTWVTDLTYRSIQLGETVTVPMQTNGTNYQIVVKRVNLAGTGRPLAPLVAPLLLEVGPDDNATSPTEYKITTNYDQENNVTITRSPVIGSADVAECPEFIANALGYDDVIVSNKWNWPGEASYFPLAVMIQAQVLCFYAAAASVFTGTAVDRAADFALPGYAFDYYSRRGVPVSGVYDLASGFAVQSTVREVYSWEEVWGESFAPEYTQISGAGKGSTSATGSGGSSSGGSGGGSVAPGVSMAAVQEWVNGQGFATETWVTNQGYLTGITEDMIADALGYTPLAPDDLLGYATQSWVTSQGYLTEITDQDVRDALGYTPVSPTDLTTALGGYVKKTGDTMTGALWAGSTSYPRVYIGNDGIGFNRNLADGTVDKSGYFGGQIGVQADSGMMEFGLLDQAGAYSIKAVILPSGHIGVNTTSPAYWLDVNGAARVTSLRIGTTTNAAASLLEWDETNRAWKLTGNFYATGWMSAGGVSSGGGASGIDLAAMWASLTNSISDSYANTKIAAAHIPDMSGTYGYLKSGDVSGVYLPIAGGQINGTTLSPLTINTTASSNYLYFATGGTAHGNVGYYNRGVGMVFQCGDSYINIADGGELKKNNDYTFLHSGNYTTWINTTTFPGLTKTGTVTSVAMTVPTGLSVSGSPITTSGTLAISFASGYSIPTTAKQTAWDGKQDAISDLSTIRNNAANGAAAYNALGNYVLKAGDTMTGPLWVGLTSAPRVYVGNNGVGFNRNVADGAVDVSGSYGGQIGVQPDSGMMEFGLLNQSGTYSKKAVIIPSGYVGINTTTPAYWLDVNGSIGCASLTATGTILSEISGGGSFVLQGTARNSNGGSILFKSAGENTNGAKIESVNSSSYSRQDLVFSLSNATSWGSQSWTECLRIASTTGNIGIGNPSPSYKVDIAGSVKSENVYVPEWSYPNLYGLRRSGDSSITSNAYPVIGFFDASPILASPTGVVRFGTPMYNSWFWWMFQYTRSSQYVQSVTMQAAESAVGFTFNVSGNIVATGAITAGAASDARLKTNIRALSADAAKRIVMGLNPVTFTWNARATELYDRYKGDDLGMIAQEVEPYLPQAIGTIFEKYKRLDYDKVVTPLVKVAQDHETRLAQAERRIEALERENTALRQQLRMS